MKQTFDLSQPPEQPTARRKALKKLLVGSGAAVAASQTLPTKWTKPVVDSVILPAHAQTTVVPTTTAAPVINFRGPVSANAIVTINNEPESLFAILDSIVPKAHAGTSTQSGDMCIAVDGTSFTAAVRFDFTRPTATDPIFLTASGTVGGGPVIMDNPNACEVSDTFLSVNSVSPGGADFTMSGFFTASGMLPTGNGCPSDPGNCIPIFT